VRPRPTAQPRQEPFGDLLDDAGVLVPHRGGVGLGEDRAHQRGHHRLRRLRHPSQQIAHEMGTAPLPGGARQGRAHPVDQTNVGVGDHQPRARQTAGDQTPQEGKPTGAVFAGDDVEAQDLAMALGVHAHGDHHGDIDDAAVLTDLLGHGVERHRGVGAAIEGPTPERRHLAVELAGHPGHLGLRQRLDAQGLHQTLDAPRADTPHVALGHHRHQRARLAGAVRAASPGSSCPPAAWGSTDRPNPPGCPAGGTDSHCGCSCAPVSPRRSRRYTAPPPRPPSAARRTCGPSHAADCCPLPRGACAATRARPCCQGPPRLSSRIVFQDS
jgi:hypothetical protein